MYYYVQIIDWIKNGWHVLGHAYSIEEAPRVSVFGSPIPFSGRNDQTNTDQSSSALYDVYLSGELKQLQLEIFP